MAVNRLHTSEASAAVQGGSGRAALRLAAAFLFLNALLSAEVLSAGMEGSAPLRVSPEGLGLLLAVCLLARPGRPLRPIVGSALTAFVIVLKLFQLADRWVPLVFNRAFNLFLDSQRLPDLIFMFWMTRPPEWVLMGLAGGAAALAAMAWGVWWAIGSLHSGWTIGPLARPSIRLPAAALSAAILAASAAGPAPGFLGAAVLPRLAEEVAFVLNLDALRSRHQSLQERATRRALQTSGDLSKLGRASVLLMVVESYGQSAFSDPRHAAAVLPAVHAIEAELRSAGFAMCSAYLRAPTFGGGSWLSHATLASGIPIDDQIGHDLLLASGLVPLAGYFNRAGYRTVRAMPGTLWPWPEGRFYRYGQTLIAPDFGYRGPRFGFAPMPDQFVLDRVLRRFIREGPGPLFVEFILTGSHAAFDIQAPYLEDWDRLGDGSVFHRLAPVTFPFGWADLAEASPAYSAAIVRALTLLKDFIRRFLDGTELVVIVGDHQPCVELSGTDQPWSVPVHVVSGNRDFIREFTDRGYTPGGVPMQPLPHPGLETLFWDLLEGFSRAPSGEAGGL